MPRSDPSRDPLIHTTVPAKAETGEVSVNDGIAGANLAHWQTAAREQEICCISVHTRRSATPMKLVRNSSLRHESPLHYHVEAMFDKLVLRVRSVVTIVRLAHSRGARAVAAELSLLKRQLPIVNLPGAGRRMLAKHNRAYPDSDRPSRLIFPGHDRHGVRSVDPFRRESSILKAHREMSVMDKCARNRQWMCAAVLALSSSTLAPAFAQGLPKLSVADATAGEGDGAIDFLVGLSASASGEVTVDYATSAGEADAGDFTAASGTLTFAAGTVEQTISVSLIDDSLDELSETFDLTLSDPAGSTIDDGIAKGTIEDDDPEPKLDFTGYFGIRIFEGDEPEVSVQLLEPSGRTVSVDYETVPAQWSPAEAGIDYTHISGTLTFDPGETYQTVSVSTVDDEVYEGSEYFFLKFTDLQGAAFARPFWNFDGEWVMTADFYMNDTEPVPGITIENAADVESAGEFAFPVTLSGPTEARVSMTYTTADGTAVAGEDYTALEHATLSFESGETSRTLLIPIVDDSLAETATEMFSVNLSQTYRPLADSVGDLQATGTILDDDGAPSLLIGDASADEGDGNLSFTVALGGLSSIPVTVGYATGDGTAAAGRDYTEATGTLTFSPGETHTTIAIALLDDDTHEARETFSVSLTGAVGATLVGGAGTGTINDNDERPFITIDGSEASEAGILEFVVTLLTASEATVSVDYLTDEGFTPYDQPAFRLAYPESDFIHKEGTLTFAPGERSKTIRVPVLEDLVDEPVEAVVLTLINPVNAQFQLRRGPDTCPWGTCDFLACCDCGTILDDDRAELTIGDASGPEEASHLEFEVSLSTAVEPSAIVSYATSDATAVAGEDYVTASGSLTFPEGTVLKTIHVTPLDDQLAEPSEEFLVTLSAPAGATLADGEATGTITDNDDPSFSVAGGTGGEGGAVDFIVTLAGPSEQSAMVSYVTRDGTAVAGEDYEVADGILTFAPGEASRTLQVPLLDDDIYEPVESFSLELLSPTNATLGVSTATGTILDDDRANKPPTKGRALLFESTTRAGRQGFVRVINHSNSAGEVLLEGVDDSGMRVGPLTLTISPNVARHFNSDDFEGGNADKGFTVGVGPPDDGSWRLELSSELDIEALSYARTADGFVTSLHDTAPATAGVHRAVFMNPGGNVDQLSRLRMINPGTADALVTIRGTDDMGGSSAKVVAELPAGASREWTAAELESGVGTNGALGDGAGKWRLNISSDRPLVAMSLIESPTGNLTNLSTLPRTPGRTAGTHAVPLFPSASDPLGRQGFVRVVNGSAVASEVRIEAFDRTDRAYERLSLLVGPDEVASFNSDDLELGNPAKGLTGSTGAGEGDWWLELSSDGEIEVWTYIRTKDGFLTAMHDLVPEADGAYRVVYFNPAENVDQVSVLWLVNPGDAEAAVTIAGVDDRAAQPGTAVRVTVPGGSSRRLTSTELETGQSESIDSGALDDGRGKWRLRVASDRPIRVMSLLENPTGHLTNLSTTQRRGG